MKINVILSAGTLRDRELAKQLTKVINDNWYKSYNSSNDAHLENGKIIMFLNHESDDGLVDVSIALVIDLPKDTAIVPDNITVKLSKLDGNENSYFKIKKQGVVKNLNLNWKNISGTSNEVLKKLGFYIKNIKLNIKSLN